jgi:hypothetical protein
MYRLATLHPNLQEAKSEHYDGLFFTKRDKEKQIREFYQKKQEIPLCIDHCGAETCGFIVPEKERIGTVVDLFNNKRGEMMVKFKLDNNHPAYQQINQGINLKGEKWGVSVWIENARNRRLGTTDKQLTHVALTTDPFFASHGTFLHRYAIDEKGIDKEIARIYYDEKSDECFASDELKRKLQGVLRRPVASRRCAGPQQSLSYPS